MYRLQPEYGIQELYNLADVYDLECKALATTADDTFEDDILDNDIFSYEFLITH